MQQQPIQTTGAPAATNNLVGAPVRISTTSSRGGMTGKRQLKTNTSANCCCFFARSTEQAVIALAGWWAIFATVVFVGATIYSLTQYGSNCGCDRYSGKGCSWVFAEILNKLLFFVETALLAINFLALCWTVNRKISPNNFQAKDEWKFRIHYQANMFNIFYSLFQFFWAFIVGLCTVCMMRGDNRDINNAHFIVFWNTVFPEVAIISALAWLLTGATSGGAYPIIMVLCPIYYLVKIGSIWIVCHSSRVLWSKFQERVLGLPLVAENNKKMDNNMPHNVAAGAQVSPYQFMNSAHPVTQPVMYQNPYVQGSVPAQQYQGSVPAQQYQIPAQQVYGATGNATVAPQQMPVVEGVPAAAPANNGVVAQQ